MKADRVIKAVIVFSLVLLLASIPLFAQGGSSEFLQGKMDGEMAAKGSAVYMLLGCGCGIFGFIAALISSPNPPATAIMGKSDEYVLGFTEGFKTKSRNKNIANACSGWALGAVLALSLSSF